MRDAGAGGARLEICGLIALEQYTLASLENLISHCIRFAGTLFFKQRIIDFADFCDAGSASNYSSGSLDRVPRPWQAALA